MGAVNARLIRALENKVQSLLQDGWDLHARLIDLLSPIDAPRCHAYAVFSMIASYQPSPLSPHILSTILFPTAPIQMSASCRHADISENGDPRFSNCIIACVDINYSELIESCGGVLPCIQRSLCCCWLDFPVHIGCTKSNANYVAPSTNHGKVCRRKRSVRTEISTRVPSLCPEMRMVPSTSSDTVP